MVDDFKTYTGISLNANAIDDSTVVKILNFAGGLSSFYSELQRTANDFFPATASTEALRKHLATRSLDDQLQPSKSHGQIMFTGAGAGISIGTGTQVKRVSDGALFVTIQSGVTDSGGNVILFLESVDTGNIQNLDSISQPFVLVTPVAGISSNCTSVSKFFDGRDLETNAEMVARILIHDRDENSGGNAVAYEKWAKDASNEVVTAKALRRVRGPDTVDLVITSGTSDIFASVEAGQPITRIPSTALLSQVQAYVNTLNPVTDDVLVKAPIEVPFSVLFRYKLFTESAVNRTYVDGIITKVIKTYIYSARPLDVLSPTDLERLVDQRIGDQIKERLCNSFAGVVTNYEVPSDSILTPNTITLSAL
jgi:uncharacterized phage protein gp47/JayE